MEGSDVQKLLCGQVAVFVLHEGALGFIALERSVSSSFLGRTYVLQRRGAGYDIFKLPYC